tara:strand:- start:1766 stop:1978 length:213 start_codon:yes stop_codon:yes gene_type:complete
MDELDDIFYEDEIKKKKEKEVEICEFCGKSFLRLKSHKCKEIRNKRPPPPNQDGYVPKPRYCKQLLLIVI